MDVGKAAAPLNLHHHCLCGQLLLLFTFKSHVYQNMQVWSMRCHINEKLCLVPSLGYLRERISRTEDEWELRTRYLLSPEEEEQQDLAANGLSTSNCSSPNWGSL